MKTLLALAFLAPLAAFAEDSACRMPVCRVVRNPDQPSPYEHVLQINGVTMQYEGVLGVGSLVDQMARYERKGICKAVYPEDN